MIEEGILDAVKDVGFPIVVTLLMILLMNTTIRKNTEAIRELTVAIKSKRWK